MKTRGNFHVAFRRDRGKKERKSKNRRSEKASTKEDNQLSEPSWLFATGKPGEKVVIRVTVLTPGNHKKRDKNGEEKGRGTYVNFGPPSHWL